MSLAIILRQDNHIWAGADTAISSSYEGKQYRAKGIYKDKIHIWNNNLIFVCGVSYMGDKLLEFIKGSKSEDIDINSVQEFLRYADKNLLPSVCEYREVSVIICTRFGQVYGMKQSSNFNIELHERPAKGVMQVISDGYRCEEAQQIARETVEFTTDILEFYSNIYDKLACNVIGGQLVLYHVDTTMQNYMKYILPIVEPKSLDYDDKLNYHAFVDSGAKTQIKGFMEQAIDVSKNAILSSSDQAPTFDETGIRLRKVLENGEYSPKQVWMNNNSIMMTSNDWNGAEIAIGEFNDTNFGSLYGVVAPAIVGTLLAGKNLVIESAKKMVMFLSFGWTVTERTYTILVLIWLMRSVI